MNSYAANLFYGQPTNVEFEETCTTTSSSSNEDRTEYRKMRNRLAAQQSRQKQKMYITSLEEQIKTLERQNMILRQKMKILETMNTTRMSSPQIPTPTIAIVANEIHVAGGGKNNQQCPWESEAVEQVYLAQEVEEPEQAVVGTTTIRCYPTNSSSMLSYDEEMIASSQQHNPQPHPHPHPQQTQIAVVHNHQVEIPSVDVSGTVAGGNYSALSTNDWDRIVDTMLSAELSSIHDNDAHHNRW